MATIITKSGRTKEVPTKLDGQKVVGLDPDGRIVIDLFDARNAPQSERPFMFALTLCCNASDKGVESGVVCRACYSSEETGDYLYRATDGTFPGLDEIAEVRP